MTDYAIARRIVDLHSRMEESVDRLYTLDEIRRYLLFARQFKPKVRIRLPPTRSYRLRVPCVCVVFTAPCSHAQISSDSEAFVVEQYKRLRQRDASGSMSKSAWRITVRQLESMIRLSEGMARMHCCDEVSATTGDGSRDGLTGMFTGSGRDDNKL